MKKAAFLLLLCMIPGFALADGDQAPETPPRHAERTGAEKVGADASVADDRLPPVFPGEEVRDGKSTIKTWSTSGPVHVSRPPEPWKDDTNYGLKLNSGVGIVVDGRDNSRTAPASPSN